MRQQALQSILGTPERREQVKRVLSEVPLKEREKKIIAYRFGLDDGNVRTLQETGDLFGITRQRAQQIEEKVWGKIKEWEA